MIFSRALELKGCVATIGNFDGVHLGHQALIQKTVERAKALNLPSVLILFEPHPKEFFLKANPLPRIQRLSDKLLKLRDFRLDYVYIMSFCTARANQTPEQFIEITLRKALHVKELIVGEDFRFGRKRSGSIEDLEAAGIQVLAIPTIEKEGRVSSSQIRTLLQAGEFKKASDLLGAPYTLIGRVTHGAKQGRLLGFPTLNLALSKHIPLSGVYAVKVFGLDKDAKLGVANVGRRPTINPLLHPLLEVYVLDYQGEAYQKRICVEFLYKVRAEKKFVSLEKLKAQIAADIAFVKHKA